VDAIEHCDRNRTMQTGPAKEVWALFQDLVEGFLCIVSCDNVVLLPL
jgi:hypothetical protein